MSRSCASCSSPAAAPGDDPSVLITVEPGYVLRIEPEQLDLERFIGARRLRARGVRRGRRRRGDARLLRRALDLWRGRAARRPGQRAVRADRSCRALHELRITAAEELFEAELAHGRSHDLVAEIEEPHRAPSAARATARAAHARAVPGGAPGRGAARIPGRATDARRRGRHRTGIGAARARARDPRAGAGARSRQAERAARQRSSPPRPQSRPCRRTARRRPAQPVAAAARGARSRSRSPPASPRGWRAPDSDAPQNVRVAPGSVAVIDLDGQPRERRRPDRRHADEHLGRRAAASGCSTPTGRPSRGSIRARERCGPSGPAASRPTSPRAPARCGSPTAGAAARSSSGRWRRRCRASMPTRARSARRCSLPRATGSTSNRTANHIAIARDAVWVVNPDFSVSRIDPRDARLTATGLVGARPSPWPPATTASGCSTTTTRWPASTGARPWDRACGWRRTGWPASRSAPGPCGRWRPTTVCCGASTPSHGSCSARSRSARARASSPSGGGAVWVVNALRGTVTRVDPQTNRVVGDDRAGRDAAQRRGRRRQALGHGRRRRRPPRRRRSDVGRRAGALPADTCGRVRLRRRRHARPPARLRSAAARRPGHADEADEPGDRVRPARARLPGRQVHDRLPVLRRLHRPDGDLRSRPSAPPTRRRSPPTRRVIGVVGPYNSGCAVEQIPIAGRAPGGALAMISPTNADVSLTRAGPTSPEGRPARPVSDGQAQLRAAAPDRGRPGRGRRGAHAAPRRAARLRAQRRRLRREHGRAVHARGAQDRPAHRRDAALEPAVRAATATLAVSGRRARSPRRSS